MSTTGDAALDRVLRALHALGGERAEGLVAEAWARAEAEVADTLTDAMRAVLLRAAAAELERGTPPPAERGTPPPAERPAPERVEAPPEAVTEEPSPAPEPVTPLRPPQEEAWYVYGIVPAEDAASLAGGSGVDPEREVVAVRSGDLAALAGPVTLADFAPDALRERLADQSWMAERVFAHEAVLRRCVEAGSVVPMRFATIVTDEAAVRSFLAESGEVLRSALDALRGRQEWGVKAYADWGRLRSHLGAGEDEGADATSGAAYFTRKRQQREGRTRAQDAARGIARAVHDELSDIAERATLLALREPEEGEPQGESMVLNGAFLVALDRLDRFHAAVDRLAAEHGDAGMRMEVTGPWPPYSFVDLSAQEAVG